MDFSQLISKSGQFVWHHKTLWVFGFFLGLNSIFIILGRQWLQHLFIADLSDPAQLADQLAQDQWLQLLFEAPEQIIAQAVGVVIILFVWGLIVWLLALWAEAAVIEGIKASKGRRLPSFLWMARRGSNRLGQFIAIDALVFLPWFLLTLVIMVLIVAVAGGTAVSNLSDFNQIAPGLLILGVVCLIPLICLLIPLAFLSYIFRLMAFREAVLQEVPVGLAVRRCWNRIKRMPIEIGATAVMTWSVRSLGQVIISYVSGAVLIFILGASFIIQAGLSTAVRLIATLPLIFFEIVVLAFITVFWTLAYQAIIERTPLNE